MQCNHTLEAFPLDGHIAHLIQGGHIADLTQDGHIADLTQDGHIARRTAGIAADAH
jgi:hypothetical protein